MYGASLLPSAIAAALILATPHNCLARGERSSLDDVMQVPASCPVSKPADFPFVPPAPYPTIAPYGNFWHGSESLWTRLPTEGSWGALPRNEKGYRQKTVWWRPGYDGRSEQRPEIVITGRRLDGDAPPLFVPHGTNAFHADFGGWAMLVGIDVPTAGCWELTGSYHGSSLTFVVWIAP